MAQANNVHTVSKKDGGAHDDELLLSMLASWKLARAEARLAWARFDKMSLFSTKDTVNDAPSAAFIKIGELEYQFSQFVPLTTLGAHEMLEAAIDILITHKRDPESSLGEGPVIDLLLNVSRVLAFRDQLFESWTCP